MELDSVTGWSYSSGQLQRRVNVRERERKGSEHSLWVQPGTIGGIMRSSQQPCGVAVIPRELWGGSRVQGHEVTQAVNAKTKVHSQASLIPALGCCWVMGLWLQGSIYSPLKSLTVSVINCVNICLILSLLPKGRDQYFFNHWFSIISTVPRIL